MDLAGLQVRPASLWHLQRDLTLCHAVFVEGFRDVPDNTPMPRAQFVGLGAITLLFTNPKMLQIATVNGCSAVGLGERPWPHNSTTTGVQTSDSASRFSFQ